jgi:uncharacterized membrane protein YjgN (DUF898 family)
MMMSGGRVNYSGAGGSLFAVYLMAIMLPIMGVYIVFGGAIAATMFATRDSATNQPSGVGSALIGLLAVCLYAGAITVALFGVNKLFKYYWDNMSIEGKRTTYHGTVGGLVSTMFVPAILTACTFGIYTPWAICKFKNWMYSQVDVSGERLQFNGDGGGLLGIWLLGNILCSVTCFIYFPWHHNNMLEYEWNNTTLSGRPFRFQKDPGGFFGMWLLNTVLTMCTVGIYTPWAMSNTWDWEAKHIG